MMTWSLGPSCGELLVMTGVAGPAAKMGHRLTLAMRSWGVEVHWCGKRPDSAELTVDVGSLEVVKGEGGVTPLAGPEKAVARANALKSLDSKKYPRIRFATNTIEPSATGYRLVGELEIHGRTLPRTVEVDVDESGQDLTFSVEATVTQSDFGVKPLSLMMGTLKAVDEVTVVFNASHPK
jgi:polyisoprenoid-binding protein YceI